MEEDFFDGLSSELVDDVDISRCGNCGSKNITSEGVCRLCSSSRPVRSRQPLKTEKRVIRHSQQKREKVTMFLGILLIVLGGPGIVAASYLHDWLRIPAPGPTFDTYEAFGTVNSLVAILGLAITVIGILFLVFSLMIGKSIDRPQLTEPSQ